MKINSTITKLNPKPRKGCLQSFTIAIKDNITTIGTPTTCASNMLKNYKSQFASTLVKKLEDNGASIIAKTNMDEFGMGSFTINSIFGATNNPILPGHSVGGSSGGSAAAVAQGIVRASIGTDTGGSVRLPAAYTSIFGFKPSYGRISRWGVISYAHSLDTVGIMAKNVKDISTIYNVLHGVDTLDPTTIDYDLLISEKAADSNNSFPVIGIPKEFLLSNLDPKILHTWQHVIDLLIQNGIKCEFVSLPNTLTALSAYYVIASAESYSNLAKYDGIRFGSRLNSVIDTRTNGFGEEVKKRLMLGAMVLRSESGHLAKAMQVRRLVANDFNSIFKDQNPRKEDTNADETLSGPKVDFILGPSTMTLAPTLKGLHNSDGYLNDIFTIPASLAGLPAIAIPFGNISLQLIGQSGFDSKVLNFADKITEITNINRGY